MLSCLGRRWDDCVRQLSAEPFLSDKTSPTSASTSSRVKGLTAFASRQIAWPFLRGRHRRRCGGILRLTTGADACARRDIPWRCAVGRGRDDRYQRHQAAFQIVVGSREAVRAAQRASPRNALTDPGRDAVLGVWTTTEPSISSRSCTRWSSCINPNAGGDQSGASVGRPGAANPIRCDNSPRKRRPRREDGRPSPPDSAAGHLKSWTKASRAWQQSLREVVCGRPSPFDRLWAVSHRWADLDVPFRQLLGGVATGEAPFNSRSILTQILGNTSHQQVAKPLTRQQDREPALTC